MLKLSQKKRKALLALAVAAAVLGANNAFAASVHDKAITESNQYGSAVRTYWKEAGVYNAKTHTYTFNEDVTLKPNASDQDFNYWTPMFGGIYIAGNKPVTIDMQGHRLDLALNVDQPKGVNNVRAVSPNAIHVSSADLVINNVKGMELSAKGSFLSAGKLRGIYVAGTNQEGAYGDGKGLASLTINNADGWENAVKFHSSQPQVENAIEVWKNTGSADLKISGMVDLYVGNDSDVITVRGGNSSYDIDKAPTAYIGGGAIKAAMGRAAVVSGGELSINSKLQDGAIVAAEGSRDVQVEGNILVKDQQKDQGILTLGMNTDKSYFKGTIFNDNGAGEVYMLLANGAQWTNERKGDYNYHNSSLNQLVGGEADAKAGNIFQKDSGSLTIDKYSGNTNIFYAHTGNGEAAENYAAGNTVIKGAAAGSVVSMITDNTGVAMDNKDSVANVLNALAGKLTYSNYVNGENNLTGYVKIADGLTASSAALKTGDISFNKEDGKGSYNVGAVKPEVPTVKEYTNTLTGFNLIDKAYADVFKDGVYKFTEDSKITNQYGMDIIENAQIDATGKTLTLVVNNPADQGAGIKVNPSNSLNIKADTVKMELTGEDISSDGLKGVNIAKAGAKLTIDGKLDITANGDNNTIGVYNQGDVVVNGDVKLDIEGNNGGYQYYGATGLYATSAMGDSKGGTITVNGDVDFQGNANGLWANAGGAVVNVNGGGSIVVKEGQDMGYAAIKAENGTVNMNVLKDEAGNVTGAADNAVTIKGNLSLDTGAVNSADVHGTKSEINLGLSTAESSLTGVVQNSFAEGGKKAGDKTFTGDANLWLQNGATWNNEVVDTIIKNPWGGEKWAGSRVTNFTGGESEAKAGNIFQKDNNSLTISNYSGNTNIFYAHTGNGEAAENYAAGDTVIKGAAAGSVVSMITDNTGVAMDNKDSVANVLNALAGKLTYSNYVNGESNLTGYVKIADGLTASSAALKTGDITFSKEDGKGSYPTETPVVPPKTEFTTALTGDAATDTEYAGNIQDGKYVFGANTTINAAAKNAVEVKAPLTIDAGNNQLVLMAKQGDYTSAVPLFKQAVEGTTSIKADKLVIKNCTNDFKERSGMEVTKGNVDINADVDMKLSSMSNAYGIYVKANGSSVAIHGDLNLADSEQFDSINGLYVENAVDFGAKTSAITVDGKADINLHNGNAITAIRNGSTVSVGGGNIKIAKNNSKEFYALQSDGGVVNVNMNADKNAAGTATTVIEGNISAYGEKANKAFDMDVTDSIVNIGLADKQSSWTGTAFAKDLGTSGFPFKGIVNLYLANGATWNNEAWGKTNAAFEGSHVVKLAGGASEAAAGNIFQKDSNNLTIDNYSGNTNIFYAHTGNGENASNYAAGDTIIKSAAAGSAVSLITDSTGIAMENDASVANVLNALAGKLTYSNFVNGENNLNGSVKIAAGLTASDKIMKVDTIKFNKDTGKGYTKEETVNPGGGEKTTFTDAITGEKQGVFSAVQQEDLSYVFAEDASININQMTHKEKDPDWEGSFIISGAAVQNAAGVENLVINAADKTLKLNVALDSKTVPPDKNAGILNNRIPLRGIDNSIAGSTTSITAGTLDINIDNTYSRKTSSGNPLIGEGSAIGIYAKSAGEKAVVEVTGNTAIKAHGYNNVYGVNANGNAEVKLHGDLTMAKDGEDWALDNVIKGQNTTTLGESSWRNIAGINANGAGASVTVDGKTTIAAHGSGVVAADGATVNLGAADIEVKNNSDEAGYGFHALGAALGTVNVGGEGKTVTVKGNAGLFGKQSQKFASDSKESVINLKLTTEDSAWTGVAYKHFDAEKDAGLSGSMNLTLANGASWNNEKYGYVYGDSEWEKYKFTGSEIANFVGGASEAKAGNIFQKDANSLTIDNYSGNTNIFYAHTGNGEAAENYAAGNTVIKHAAEGSVVSMITDNTGIAMDNQASVNNVLNALAGKLTYSNFVNGEKNLTGFVKIADGLTASSAALKTGDITFNEADGKGGFVSAPVIPDHQVTTSFTTTLTGDKEQDEEYLLGGVIAADGTYKFTETSDITAVSAINTAKDLKIDATGKTLTVNTAGTDSAAITVLNDGGSNVDIKADKLVIKSSSEYAGKNSGIYAGDWKTTRKNVNITADVDITATNTVGNNNYVYGVLASKADITVNGSLKANIDGGKGGYDHTSVSALIAQGSSYRKYASTITVNGDVDITANGNGLHANNNGAVVTVNGGGAITINDSSAKGGYAALRAGNGTVNMNVALENGKATGGLGKDVAIKGNLAAVKAGDQTASAINLALDTAKSSLEGVSYMTEGNGQINLWLQNGASWTNEVHGSAEKDWKGNSLFNGSHVTNFAGGASDAKAGNIFQKDANSLTIDNYSGNTNIFYAHTGNGEAAENYTAGDTVIKHAAEGSVVSMITDNSGIAMDNAYSVANVLNALAGKLTYSNFVNGEKNLTGYVKIADGLTASSKAMQTGDISFSAEDGKGSLKDGSLKPGFTYPETQKPGSNVINQGITGNAKDDYQLKMDGILKEDGSYVFTQDPTKIEVKEGAAVGATDKDIVIDTTKAKLELKGETGINAEGANVTVNGNTSISGATGINAANGNVTLNGSTVISGTDAAINAGADANVVVNGNNSALTVNGSINADGGNITVDSGKATGTIKGDINAANGGSVVINLTEKGSTLTGGYNVDGDSSIALGLANGATWKLTDGEEAAGMSLLRMAKGAADAGLTINGGKTEAEKGFLDMTKRTKTLDIAHYSGWETVIYDHEGKGDKVEDYKSGDTVIAKADKGSGVILSTDGSGITMTDKKAVEATLKALAQKVTYKDHAANGENLSGKVQIAEGLTSSSVSKNLGTIHWDENGKGQYDLDSVNWNQIIEGDYETFVMKGVRSAATTSLHTWRDNMQDTYTGAYLADEDGMFAKALGGKTSSDVQGLKDSNTYYGVQVGYDKAAANGWHTGVAFDYRNGDSNYLLGGKGDNQMYSLGVYGVKNFENDAFFRVAAKVGRVENEYDVYNEIRSLKLNGDYKANAYGLTMEYGKTFGDEEAYFTPKAQLTWSQVGAKDYTAHTDNATMQISQDSYSSFVGRLGFEAGVKSEKGRVYAGLFAAHEFNGDISASYFANDGDRKHTSFDGEETWMEMKLGGTYDFSNNAHLYADIAKDFNGNFERKWKMNVGLRFEF
ncbi:autotransporter outer membrane beta-barrel domain-containing protein [Phascolarctobacterium succinatutens]|uniref:autotransporter outer membrane beta-barrel domain-containing protein n=1 Tax=Phascolarctobacterium succinatutens TaxID=626940 RepID=UPI0026F2809D|nr:autotransporter outer membrane beta-barrel domain-containing protein [Phascolarctobacterium succinatutens]